MTSKNFVIYLKRRFRRFVGIFSVPSKADVCLSIDLLCHGRLNRNQSMEISWDSFGSVYLLLSAIASVYTVDCLQLVPVFLYSLYLTLYKTEGSVRRTLSAGPKSVGDRDCIQKISVA